MTESEIDNTAVIHPDARIGRGCKIGPYCIIGKQIKLGAGSHLQSHVVLDGNLSIGENAEIFPFACLGKKTQDLKHEGKQGEIKIGDNATIREYVTVHMPTGEGLTSVGDNCHLLAYCHIAHDCWVGDDVIMSNSTHLAGHVIVEDKVIFGGMIGVHQFCHIGAMSMIGAHSKVVQDIVPFSLADGNPALPRSINKIGMNRRGLDHDTIRAVRKAHRLLFRSGLPQEEALRRIKEQLRDNDKINAVLQFVQTSERGLARPPARKPSASTNTSK